MDLIPTTQPRRTDDAIPEAGRRTVIPTPRSNAMFPGWGVRF
jgi:hypothetical protein